MRAPTGVGPRQPAYCAVLAGGFFAAILAGAGCDSGGGGASIRAMQHPTLEDFPVPEGFALVRGHSQSRTSGSMRMVQYEFKGSRNWSKVAQFFREQLPPAGWTLRQQRLERGPYYLRFESDKEECDIAIRPSGLSTFVNVDIGPLARGAVERAEAPAQPARRRPPKDQ